MKTLKFIIVDDNTFFRNSVRDLLTNKYHYEVIAEAGNGEEFLRLDNSYFADIILMDLAMPKIDGIEATKSFFWKFPNSRIIAVTNHTEKAYLRQLIENGFKGCIFKNNLFNELELAIETVMKGKLWFPEDIQFNIL